MDLLEQMETSDLQEGEGERKEKEKEAEEGDSVVRSSSLDVMDLLEQMETSDLQEGEGEKRRRRRREFNGNLTFAGGEERGREPVATDAIRDHGGRRCRPTR